jgi:hypothetical protein
VLRLRGGRVDRLVDGDNFCRADFRMPAGHAVCELPVENVDLCADRSSIPLALNPCSGVLSARFTSCLRYGESCGGRPSCSVEMILTATPARGAESEGCEDMAPVVETDPCASACDACACADD